MSGSSELSPRQKMINMMYLVLMAMLALNVSIEVIEAFINVGNNIDENVQQLENKNRMLYDDLKMKKENNPVKYKDMCDQSLALKGEADKLVNTIRDYKSELIYGSGAIDRKPNNERATISDVPKEKAKTLEKTSAVNEFLFGPGGKAEEFEEKYVKFRDVVIDICKSKGFKNLEERVKKVFSTEKVKKGETKMDWLKYKFEHYPLAAGLAFMAQMESNIRVVEADLMRAMGGKITGDQIAVNTVEAIMIPTSITVIKNTPFKAKVMLAAYDNTLEPEVILYKYDNKGNKISGTSEVKVVEGKGNVEIPTNSLGDKYWGGVVKLKKDDGTVKSYEFKGVYNVTEPIAVMSPTKMNVVYRGVQNPMEVSVPGISPSAITVKGPGIRKLGGGKYTVNVTNYRGGRNAKYTIVANMPDGKQKVFPPKIFRVKDIPSPSGTVRGESTPSMPISNLMISTIGAGLPGFEFSMKLNVTGFSMKVEGQPTVKVRGNRLNQRAKKVLRSAKIGSDVVIRDIKVSLPGNSKYRVKTPSPVSVKITGK